MKLAELFPKAMVEKFKPAPPLPYIRTDFFECLYFGDDREAYYKYRTLIAEKFKDAKVEDDSDGIHGYRLSVEASSGRQHWFKFLIAEKLEGKSLVFRLTEVFDDPQDVIWQEFKRNR